MEKEKMIMTQDDYNKFSIRIKNAEKKLADIQAYIGWKRKW